MAPSPTLLPQGLIRKTRQPSAEVAQGRRQAADVVRGSSRYRCWSSSIPRNSSNNGMAGASPKAATRIVLNGAGRPHRCTPNAHTQLPWISGSQFISAVSVFVIHVDGVVVDMATAPQHSNLQGPAPHRLVLNDPRANHDKKTSGGKLVEPRRTTGRERRSTKRSDGSRAASKRSNRQPQRAANQPAAASAQGSSRCGE